LRVELAAAWVTFAVVSSSVAGTRASCISSVACLRRLHRKRSHYHARLASISALTVFLSRFAI
jgi:hypothetical protein